MPLTIFFTLVKFLPKGLVKLKNLRIHRIWDPTSITTPDYYKLSCILMSKIGSSFGSGFFWYFSQQSDPDPVSHNPNSQPFLKGSLSLIFFSGLKEHNTYANESGQVCAKKQFAIIFPACHFPLDPSSINARGIIDQSSIDQLAARHEPISSRTG